MSALPGEADLTRQIDDLNHKVADLVAVEHDLHSTQTQIDAINLKVAALAATDEDLRQLRTLQQRQRDELAAVKKNIGTTA